MKTDGGALLAEKHRFSRWGPYVIHIGLIIFLLAVLARGLPGLNMDQHLAFPQGEITQIPDTTYYLKNEKFTVEFYTEEEMPEEFRGKKYFQSYSRPKLCFMNAPRIVETHRRNHSYPR